MEKGVGRNKQGAVLLIKIFLLIAISIIISSLIAVIILPMPSVAACGYKDCDKANNKWCDSSGKWLISDYCTDTNVGCGYKDADCISSLGSCLQGECDTSAKKYCSSNSWLSAEYCDVSHCYNDDTSYCSSCTKTESAESTCNDDLDNDCDHYFDCNDQDCTGKAGCECTTGQTRQCGTTDLGECTYATQTCISGSWSECTAILPSDELCDDSMDNDCDGVVDEEDCRCISGLTRVCGLDIGACHAGIQACVDGVWSACYGQSYSSAGIEVCDGMDNDCDNLIDETCSCISGTLQSCGTDIGICEKGMQTCINGTWSSCSGAISPVSEVCSDGLDNDCDGLVDLFDDNCQNQTQGGAGEPQAIRQASCTDDIQNQGETGIDCGGPCIPCSTAGKEGQGADSITAEEAEKERFGDEIADKDEKYTFSLVVFVILIPIFIAFLILVYYFFIKRKLPAKQAKKPAPKLPKAPFRRAVKKTQTEREIEKIK